MILGDNPAGNGFILMDLILVELSGHAPPPAWGMGGEGGGGLKISERSLVGGVRNFNFGGGLILLGWLT